MMGEVIDARARFAPRDAEEFESGEKVAPGVYVDTERNTVLTLWETDTLPDEVRIVRTPCRYRRFESRDEAYTFVSMQKELQKAA